MSIIDVKPAGPGHQVITHENGCGDYMRRPCPTCPWRTDAVGEFPAEAFRHSAHTAYDMSERPFGCHQAGVKTPKICAGYLLRGADHRLTVRVARMKGKIADDVSDAGIDLFDSYRDMAEANGVDPDDPVLSPCR